MTRMISYSDKGTWIHKLSGFTKLLFFILWCTVSALTYDTRVLRLMILVGIYIFIASKTEWKQISSVFKAVMFFMILNLIFIYIFAPSQGTAIYGTRHVLLRLSGPYSLTREQLFYEFNVMIKYFTVVPAAFIFLITTNPSEFAASLNGVGIPASISYSVAITLRYIPDIQDEYHKIRNAQEARGIELSSKGKVKDRIRNTAAIIFPLLFTSMERIDTVSNAMELRGFGKKRKRTWYSRKALSRNDILVLVFIIVFSVAALVFTYYDGSRFYNPFH